MSSWIIVSIVILSYMLLIIINNVIRDNSNNQNQKAIECLKELERDIRETIEPRYVDVGERQAALYVDYLTTLGLIDNKIKELEKK